METFIEQHASQISGVLSCYDRLIFQGNLQAVCWGGGMVNHLLQENIRIFDYPKYANTIRETLRADTEEIAKKNDVQIEYIAKKHIRKEEVVREVLKKRGHETPGLVHIISAMETCSAFKPRYDKKTGNSTLVPTVGKCLHYYFYFIDEKLGLCFLRVPTWAPCRAQFYCNGHYWLANKLDKKKIGYELVDNAFAQIDDFEKAQKLSDQLNAQELHKVIKHYVKAFCPTLKIFGDYHWSINQAEYATDIIFKNKEDLSALYSHLVEDAVLSVKPDHVATFLGKKLTGHFQDEAGNRLDTRLLGTRLRHSMGKQSIKMYDKHGIMLRIETTTSDVSFLNTTERLKNVMAHAR